MPLDSNAVGLRLELSSPDHPDQGPEAERGKRTDWDLVGAKNEKVHDFTDSSGASPSGSLGARVAGLNPSYPISRQIVDLSEPGHRE